MVLCPASETKRRRGVVFLSGQLQAGPNMGSIAVVQHPFPARGPGPAGPGAACPNLSLPPASIWRSLGAWECWREDAAGGGSPPPPPARRQRHRWPPCYRQLSGQCTWAGETAYFTTIKIRIDLSFEDRKMAVGVSARCPFYAAVFFFFF